MPDSRQSAKDAQSYPLRAELRRATLWASGGSIPAALLVLVLAHFRLLPRGDRAPVIAGFFVILALGLLMPLWPRLRMDKRGLHRRILWWWDLWPWEAFRDGRVSRTFSRRGYRFADRKFRNEIDLSLLDDYDADAADTWIRANLATPLVPPVANSVTIRLRWPNCRTVTITSAGLTVSRRNQTREYTWDEVIAIQIWRVERGRTDFREVTIELPDLKIALAQHSGDTRNWTGAESAAISNIFTRHLNPSRLRDYAQNGPPASLEERRRRRRELAGQRRQKLRTTGQRCLYFLGLMVCVSPLILHWIQALVLLWVLSIELLAIMFIHYLSSQSERRERLIKYRREGRKIQPAPFSVHE